MSSCQPPYTITPEILDRVAAICEAIGRLTVLTDQARGLRLRRINRIRSIHGPLAPTSRRAGGVRRDPEGENPYILPGRSGSGAHRGWVSGHGQAR